MIDLDAIRRQVAILQTHDRREQFPHERQLCDLLDYVDELREAAGKVTCWRCEGYGEIKPEDTEGCGPDDMDQCPDCSPLRTLLTPEVPHEPR